MDSLDYTAPHCRWVNQLNIILDRHLNINVVPWNCCLHTQPHWHSAMHILSGIFSHPWQSSMATLCDYAYCLCYF